MVGMLHEIAQGGGDLTRRMHSTRRNELGAIAEAFNLFLDKLQALIREVVHSVHQVNGSASNSAGIAARTRKDMQLQMDEISQVVTAVNEMAATTHEIAHSATQASNSAQRAEEEASTGTTIVEKNMSSVQALAVDINLAVDAVRHLAEESNNISSILSVIGKIAEQTNLLALNAAIEAARAGEQGRGFAVVADEVRNLAQKTQGATGEIQTLIQQLQRGVKDAVDAMKYSQMKAEDSVQQSEQVTHALERIAEAVSVISDMNTQIASAVEEQATVAEEIQQTMVNINQVASAVSQGTDEASHASTDLGQLASRQRELVGVFQVK
jgi:methyl-accepting chemotaxis protein